LRFFECALVWLGWQGGPLVSAMREVAVLFRELRAPGLPNEDREEWDLDPLDDCSDASGDAEENDAGGTTGFFGRALMQDDALHDHAWDCRPYYYIPDRETGSVPVPLLPESSELVSPTDVNPKPYTLNPKT